MKIKNIIEPTRLNESGNKLHAYLRTLLPGWPEYVIYDLVYRHVKIPHKDNSKANIQADVDGIASTFGYADANDIKWKLVNITIHSDIFDKSTLYRMSQRDGGKLNPFKVPNDANRHSGARERSERNPNMKTHGYSGPVKGEPIILIKHIDGKYELIEGWHRTMQNMALYPNGYNSNAYVADYHN